MKIKLIKFNNFYKTPKRAHYNDAGLDLYTPDDFTIPSHDTITIPLGFGIELPDGLLATVISRSSAASRGLLCHMSPVDSGYNGQIHLILTNLNNYDVDISKGERVGQLVVMPFIPVDLVTTLGGSRESKNLGSTGIWVPGGGEI